MKRLGFAIEVLTPAFVGGHEPRKLDEYTPLRPHTLRGLLRWWFRAGAASLLWPADDTVHARERCISELYKVESALFGDTRHASNVLVGPTPSLERSRCGGFPKPDPRRSPGLRYLGYGLFEGHDPQAIHPHRTPGAGTMEIPLALRRDVTGAPELLGATVWLWCSLGGLGARSRRGFGSLRLARADEALGIPRHLLESPGQPGALAERLDEGVRWATGVFREHLPKLTTFPLQQGPGPHPELRTLCGLDAKDAIAVLPGMYGSGVEAQERVGRLFQSFRSTLERHQLGMPPLRDYFTVKTSITSRRPPTSLDRAAFGLPLPFYFRSLQGAKATFIPQGGDRLASPLLIRVHALGAGPGQRFVATLINLVARHDDRYIHPLLGKQLIERGDREQSFPPPGGAILRQFMQWAKVEASKSQARRLGRER